MNKRALWILILGFLAAVTAVSAQQAQPLVQPSAAPPSPASPQQAQQAPAQTGPQGTIVRNVNLVEVLFSVVTKRENSSPT